jgi:hypothetical protein
MTLDQLVKRTLMVAALAVALVCAFAMIAEDVFQLSSKIGVA